MSWQPSSMMYSPWGVNSGQNLYDLSGIGGQRQTGGAWNGDITNGAATNSPGVLGWNVPTMQMGLQGLNTIGNIWGAWQSNKLARDQLNFTKMITNTNLNNQIKSYNTALEDRSRSRAAVEGQSASEAQSYIDHNRLSRS